MKLITGPCMMESLDLLRQTAQVAKEISEELAIEVIFKSSFDKANRSSIKTERGPGLEEGLKMMECIKKEFNLRVTTDVHTPEQIDSASSVIDILQIPAFLARQTDFYIRAGKNKVAISVKKGQFMAPWEMENAIAKYRDSGGENIWLIERGTTFGYGNLVVDFRGVDIIRSMGVPYIFDATHSVQLPAARGSRSGGQREFIPSLVRAAIAAGADGLFMEIHPCPQQAKSDKETQFPLSEIKDFIKKIKLLYDFVRDTQKL